MTPNLLFYQLLLVALVLICIVIHVWWPDSSRATPPRPLMLDQPRRKRPKGPKLFTGYIHKPLCEACEQGIDQLLKAPGSGRAGSHPWQRLGQGVATAFTSDGGGLDRSHLDVERSADVSGAAVSPASYGLRTGAV
jgi:hypothetical protein